ncbi:MAG: DEAD/DEAH box helicase [Gammaproteobacteria bacterium]|nr:DEAD/DEAH box helicase [Gammaproteobacteria bacterium]
MTPDSPTSVSASATPENDNPEALVRFSDLDLPEPLLRSTEKASFDYCTSIQANTLPHIIECRDVAAQAQTGTGKTAAFLLGAMTVLLNRKDKDNRQPNQPRMLVIAPTRELAIQIQKDAEMLGEFTGFRSRIAYGGADYDKQRNAISEGVDILIGTPGRLIDYFKKRVFDFKALEIVVLDEADRMFDLGFIADIRFLLRRMPEPEQRISMLFSATLSSRVMELAYEHMNAPVTVKTGTSSVTAEGVRQQLFHPAADEKISLLLGLISSLEPPRSIIFVNTKRAAERVEGFLRGNDVDCGTLSGDVRQNKRQRILADFTSGKLPVLIATDVAARGLHIDDVTHVFNFDLPQQAEDYVHRIGRTARAGGIGEAISFACEEYSYSLPEILEYIGQDIPSAAITNELLPTPRPPVRVERDRPPAFGQKGKKQSRPPRNARRHKDGDRERSAAPSATEAVSAEPIERAPRRRRRRRRRSEESGAQTAVSPNESGQ